MTIVVPVGFMTSGDSNNATPNIRGSAGGTAWNSGFDTVETIPASTAGWAQYTLRQTDYDGPGNLAAFGLSYEGDSPATGYSSITACLRVTNSTAAGYYSGTRVTPYYSFSDGATGYVFRNSSNQIGFKVNSTIFSMYTSVLVSSVELKGDGSVGGEFDRLENIILNDGTNVFNPEFDNKVYVTEY